jgi:hypothetical protein
MFLLNILFGLLWGICFGVYVMEKLTKRTKRFGMPALALALLFMVLWIITNPVLKISY